MRLLQRNAPELPPTSGVERSQEFYRHVAEQEAAHPGEFIPLSHKEISVEELPSSFVPPTKDPYGIARRAIFAPGTPFGDALPNIQTVALAPEGSALLPPNDSDPPTEVLERVELSYPQAYSQSLFPAAKWYDSDPFDIPLEVPKGTYELIQVAKTPEEAMSALHISALGPHATLRSLGTVKHLFGDQLTERQKGRIEGITEQAALEIKNEALKHGLLQFRDLMGMAEAVDLAEDDTQLILFDDLVRTVELFESQEQDATTGFQKNIAIAPNIAQISHLAFRDFNEAVANPTNESSSISLADIIRYEAGLVASGYADIPQKAVVA